RRAGAFRSIGVYATHAAVRPSRPVQLAARGDLDAGAVAAFTAERRRRATLDHLAENVVGRTDKRRRVGVPTRLLLFELLRMTARAVKRRDDGRDASAVMLESVHVLGLGLMAGHATDAAQRVLRVLPLQDDHRRGLLMAAHTLARIGGDDGLRSLAGLAL